MASVAATYCKLILMLQLMQLTMLQESTSAGDKGFIEHVKVNASEDGRFEIASETGPVII